MGEFTTPHNCCETRVRNIQRIADIVRGVYLVPGETISLNEYVGPRTVENGFFSAGAIRQGHLIEEVGGGVSQFATTIFNAAYFAGMDFVEYRSHSLYFSRYPYGREATISNPAPDLVMTNTTNHPILIWTSYTDESITVSMYSTKHIEIEELDQRTSSRGACTHVETDRQRTYPDGGSSSTPSSPTTGRQRASTAAAIPSPHRRHSPSGRGYRVGQSPPSARAPTAGSSP